MKNASQVHLLFLRELVEEFIYSTIIYQVHE